MQRYHATTGSDFDVLGDRGDRGTRDGGIGIGTPKRVEMSLGSPDRGKTVLVEVFRAFHQQTILGGSGRIVVAPHEKPESDVSL